MRPAVCVTACLGLAVLAAGQTPTASWRQNLMTLPARPAPNTTPRDIYRFEQNLRSAAAYFSALKPGDYEANRELVRRMAAYLMAVGAMVHDPEMRRAVDGASRTFYSLGIASALLTGPPLTDPDSSALPQNAAALPQPFGLRAPDVGDVPEPEKSVAAELAARYTTSAARASATWQNAETIRLNLAARGLTLNVETATALARMPLDFKSAADELRSHNWDDARVDLQRAEYETDKIAKVVGR